MMNLPKGWTNGPLAKLGTWTGGGTPNTGNPAFWSNGTIPWVSPKDMKQPRIAFAQDSITEDAIKSSATNLIAKNSVMLVTRSGILRHSLPVAINTKPVTMNQDMKALTPLEGVESDYLYFALRRFEREILRSCCKGGTTVQSIEAPRLMAFEIPIAPTAEQRRIVAKIEELFSELDKGIENLKQARAQLGVYRQALLKHAFEGKLTAVWRATNKGELESADRLLTRIRDEIPEKSKNRLGDAVTNSCGWLKLTLAEITADALIGLVRASALQNQEGRGFSYIKMDRVDMSGHVDIAPETFVDCSDDEVKRFALREGDILFNTRNSVELVGKTGLVRKPPPAPTVFNNNLMRMRTVPAVLPASESSDVCSAVPREYGASEKGHDQCCRGLWKRSLAAFARRSVHGGTAANCR